MKNLTNRIIPVLIFSIIFFLTSCVATKDASNLDDNYAGFKRVIDVVAQRYIIEDVLKLSDQQKIKLKINEISEDVNTYRGDMSKLFIYEHEGRKGMVVTAFNVLQASENSNASFSSTHFTPEDLEKINAFYASIDKRKTEQDDFYAFKLNDEVTVNIYRSYARLKMVLLMSQMNKAEIFDRKWEKIYRDFKAMN